MLPTWWPWLVCILAPDLSDDTIRALDARYTLAHFITHLDMLGPASGLSDRTIRAIQQPDPQVLERQQAWLGEPHHHLIPLTDARYPLALRMIDRPPLLLWVMGDVSTLHHKQLAMVGSRKASFAGLSLTRAWASACAAHDWVITSGLAMGIDAAAHQGAMDVGGHTVAVLGSALDSVYPPSHRHLAEQITEFGCVISQWPLGTGPRRGHFPARNAVISGLSMGVVVMEADLKSGSLITARLAGEQGREVFAVPGSVKHPLSAGCHHLIRSGAKCVSHVNDIFEEFSCIDSPIKVQSVQGSPKRRLDALAPDAKKLLQCVLETPTPWSEMADSLAWPAEKIFRLISDLEIDGWVKKTPGGYFRLP